MGPEPRIRILEMSLRLGMRSQSLVLSRWSLASSLASCPRESPYRRDPPYHVCHPEERGICSFSGSIALPQSSDKSCQVGFTDLISSSFFALDHPLICFSRAIAFP